MSAGADATDGLQLNDPQTLYRRWEDSQWSPWQVDLSTDRDQWPNLSDEQRGHTAPVAQVLGELRRVINRRW